MKLSERSDEHLKRSAKQSEHSEERFWRYEKRSERSDEDLKRSAKQSWYSNDHF